MGGAMNAKESLSVSLSANLFDRFTALSDRSPRPFLQNGGRAFTYAEAHDRSAQLARALVQLGVRPGDRIAVQVEKSASALLLYLASLRIGAIYVPLNTAYTLAELQYFIGDAEPALLVCAPEKETMLAVAVPQVRIATLGTDEVSGSLLALADRQSSRFDTVARTGADLATILYTSGTTGRSKGAMLSHDNLGSNCFTLKDCWRFTARDVLLHSLPIFHTHGLFVATNVTLAAGASMILLPKFDPTAIREQLPRATVMMGVPTFYTRLLQETWLNIDSAAHMRLFVSGSAPLLADTHRQWRERTGHAILERYGMTETNMNTSNPYEGDRVPGTVGPPLPGVSVRVVGLDDGAPRGADDTGMLEVKGPNVFSGYWRMPEKTAAEFRDGYFITGDIGKIDARGYVHIVGRGKDLVISGGFNVYPKEVETELDALPGVLESAVIGVPHADYGEAVTAVVVAPGAASELTEQAVIARLRARLAAYKLPKRVVFVDDLPRNTMGKVQKNVLRERYAGLYLNRA